MQPGLRSFRSLGAELEKQTDVNIAVRMLRDAYEDGVDLFLLLTADTDQWPVVNALANELPRRREVHVWFPPWTQHNRWSGYAGGRVRCKEITADMLESSRLPEDIFFKGKTIRCPDGWRQPSIRPR